MGNKTNTKKRLDSKVSIEKCTEKRERCHHSHTKQHRKQSVKRENPTTNATKCIVCGKPVDKAIRLRRFCSFRCTSIFYRKKKAEEKHGRIFTDEELGRRIQDGVYGALVERRCINCGAAIKTSRGCKLYCSPKCRRTNVLKKRRMRYAASKTSKCRTVVTSDENAQVAKHDGQKIFKVSDSNRFPHQYHGKFMDRLDALKKSLGSRFVSLTINSNRNTCKLTLKCEKCGREFDSLYSTCDAPRFCSKECAIDMPPAAPRDDAALIKRMVAAETVEDDSERNALYDVMYGERMGDITAMVAIKMSQISRHQWFQKLISQYSMLPRAFIASAWKASNGVTSKAKGKCAKKKAAVEKEAAERRRILKRIEKEKALQNVPASAIRRRRSAEWAEKHREEIQRRRDLFAKYRAERARKYNLKLDADRKARKDERKRLLSELRSSGLLRKYDLVKDVKKCDYCGAEFPYVDISEILEKAAPSKETFELRQKLKRLKWARCCCDSCSSRQTQLLRSKGNTRDNELRKFQIVSRGTGFYAQSTPQTVYVKRRHVAAFLDGAHGLAVSSEMHQTMDEEKELAERLDRISYIGERANALFENSQQYGQE